MEVQCQYCDTVIAREKFSKHLNRRHTDIYLQRKHKSENGLCKPKVGEDFKTINYHMMGSHQIKKGKMDKCDLKKSISKLHEKVGKVRKGSPASMENGSDLSSQPDGRLSTPRFNSNISHDSNFTLGRPHSYHDSENSPLHSPHHAPNYFERGIPSLTENHKRVSVTASKCEGV